MPRFRSGRGLLRGVCWLVLLCVAEIPAATPVLAADPIGSECVAFRPVADATGRALPPPAPGAPGGARPPARPPPGNPARKSPARPAAPHAVPAAEAGRAACRLPCRR